MESQSIENNSNLAGYENQEKLLKINFKNIKNRNPNTLNIRNINKNKIKRPISSNNYSINKKICRSLNDENNKFEIHTKLEENSCLNLKRNIYFSAYVNNSNLLKNSINFNNKYKEHSNNSKNNYFSDKENDSSNLYNSNNLRYNKNQSHFFSSMEKINNIKYKNIFSNRNSKYSSLSTKNMTKQRTTFDNQDKIKCKSTKNINKPNFPLYKERKIKSSDDLIYSNNLIEYKEVVCNSPEIPFNINYYKKQNYNNLIRIRNKQKINNDKRYSFYKYKEYMDKIEDEKIEIYKKEQEKKNKVNIQKIFHKIPTNNKKNQIISKNEIKSIELNGDIKYKNNNDKILFSNDLNRNIKEDEYQSDIKTDKKIEEDNIIIKTTPKKNKINKNKKTINKLKKNHKAMSYTSNKNNNKNKEKDEYENQFFESDITINNFFDSKKILNFNKIQKNEKNLFYQEEPLMLNDIKNELNISDDDFNIEMLNDKDLKNKIGDNEAYELLKMKYFKNKERMMLMNKRNIKAQNILFKKIIESDKDQKLKRPSQLEPFFNLKFKYTDEEINLLKQKYFSKYYEKNKNNFTPTKKKESFNTNNNIIKQYNSPSPKNIEGNNETSIKEKNNVEDKVEDDKKDNDKIGNDKIDDDIIKVYTDNSIIKKDENNGIIFINREINNLKKSKKSKKNKNNNIIKEKGYLKNFIEKYIKNMKKEDDGGKVKEEIPEKVIEEVNHKFENLIHENDDIIESKKEEAELFLGFKEKMISLARYSKKEYNLYLVKNYKYIAKALEDCKRDKEREERIDKFLKALNEDLKMNCMYKSDLWQDIKVIDYQPFISFNKNKK